MGRAFGLIEILRSFRMLRGSDQSVPSFLYIAFFLIVVSRSAWVVASGLPPAGVAASGWGRALRFRGKANPGSARPAPTGCSTIPLPSVTVHETNLHTQMTTSDSRFGFVSFAETWNGRLAMLGFVIGLATEVLTGQGILSQIGLG
jgi:ferrochelatase